MSDRCEPPPGLRDAEGLHMIRYDTGDCSDVLDCWTWVPADLCGTEEGAWTKEPGRELAHLISPGDFEDEAGCWNARWVAPVPQPAEIAALVRAARALRNEAMMTANEHTDHPRSDALYTLSRRVEGALAPFQNTEPKDG